MNRPATALLAAAIAAAAGAMLWLARDSRAAAAAPAAVSPLPPATTKLKPLPPPLRIDADAAPLVLTLEDHAFVRQLRYKFGARLGDKHAQIKAIEQLMAYLQQHYPDDWLERMRAFLSQVFPEFADALLARFEALHRLNEWLATNRAELMRLTPAERRAALWAARREAFGADADEIYAGEVRNERLAEALRKLDDNATLTTGEKLAQYLDAVHQAYGERAQEFIEARQTDLVNRFLDAPSVQEQLGALSPAERSASLREIRSGLGMDEAALGRWDALDQQRDQAWEAGQRYLQERERILEQYRSEARERELAALQDRQFGAEAETIRQEEAAGFYRHGHARRYGRE